MNSLTLRVMTLGILIAAVSTPCCAGVWSKALREGAEALLKRSGKVVREGTEESLKHTAARRALREGLEAATEQGVARTGRVAGTLVARFGDDVARPILGKFGDDGARALGSLSPTGARRLATMADELAAGGRGGDWMRLIAQRGDEVTDWLWKRRGGVAVGTVAAAVLVQPEEFIQATERVAAPFVDRAAAAIPWAGLWTLAILGGGFWFAMKRKSLWWRW